VAGVGWGRRGRAGGACAGPPYSQGKASERVTNADAGTVSLTIALLTSSAISSVLVLRCRREQGPQWVDMPTPAVPVFAIPHFGGPSGPPLFSGGSPGVSSRLQRGPCRSRRLSFLTSLCYKVTWGRGVTHSARGGSPRRSGPTFPAFHCGGLLLEAAAFIWGCRGNWVVESSNAERVFPKHVAELQTYTRTRSPEGAKAPQMPQMRQGVHLGASRRAYLSEVQVARRMEASK